MARVAEGWSLVAKRGIWHVRFTLPGQARTSVTTGERDKSRAAVVAARLYQEALTRARDGQRKPSETSKLPLVDHVAEWLTSLVTTHDESTRELMKIHARKWLRREGWSTLADITTGAMGDWARERLGQVEKVTVQKELSALRQMLLWADEQGHLAYLPDPPALPKRAAGTRASKRPEGTTPVSLEEVDRILAQLPEWSSERHDRFSVAAYFEFFAETGLRPSTLMALETPKHWKRGDLRIVLTPDIDKTDFGRELPITPRAMAALHASLPLGEGLIFGPNDRRSTWLRAAARAAGLPDARARKLVPYDLRHSRITHLVAAGANLPGVQHLVGHKRLSTTERYVHANKDHAAEALAVVAPVARRSGERPGVAPRRGSGPILVPHGREPWSCSGPNPGPKTSKTP